MKKAWYLTWLAPALVGLYVAGLFAWIMIELYTHAVAP